MMKTFEENQIAWNKILDEITHPLHKAILNNFHSDMYQDILYHIEEGNIQKDFNSIMNCVLEFILMNVQVQIKATKEFELLEIAIGNVINEKVNELFNANNTDIYYIIEDYISEEEFKIQWEKEGCGENDDVYACMNIKFNLTKEQLALMELTNIDYKIGRIVEDYLNVYGTYINGKHFEEFEK